MTSNVSDYCNESEERNESEECLFDTWIVEDNTSTQDGTVSDFEQQLNQAVFKRPKKPKTQFKTASEQMAEPMITFLKSRTKEVNTEDSLELLVLFFKSFIFEYKKLNDQSHRRFKQVVLSTSNNFIDDQEQNKQA